MILEVILAATSVTSWRALPVECHLPSNGYDNGCVADSKFGRLSKNQSPHPLSRNPEQIAG